MLPLRLIYIQCIPGPVGAEHLPCRRDWHLGTIMFSMYVCRYVCMYCMYVLCIVCTAMPAMPGSFAANATNVDRPRLAARQARSVSLQSGTNYITNVKKKFDTLPYLNIYKPTLISFSLPLHKNMARDIATARQPAELPSSSTAAAAAFLSLTSGEKNFIFNYSTRRG